MFFPLKIKLRQILAVGLVAIAVFFSFGMGTGEGDRALAEVLKRDATAISESKPLNDAEYESAKANRNQIQAEMSKKAELKAESKAKSESVAEKLNLDEITVPTVEDILD